MNKAVPPLWDGFPFFTPRDRYSFWSIVEYKIQQIIVYPNRQLEVHLNPLPLSMALCFERYSRCQITSSVPISVSSPWIRGSGIAYRWER